jgi:hypothetical protein
MKTLRTLKAILLRVFEWSTVMTTLAWLLAHARSAPALPRERRRRPTKRSGLVPARSPSPCPVTFPCRTQADQERPAP